MRILKISVLTLLLLATTTFAETYTVNTTADTVDINIGDGICADTSSPAKCSIRAAIQEANSDTTIDTISIPEGIYNLSISGSGEDNAATGDLDIINPLNILGAAKDTTIIDGNSLDRIFHITNDSEVTFKKITIQDGFITGDGGAILNSATTEPLLIEDCNFLSNGASLGTGGAIDSASGVLISDSVFFQNASGDEGGDIYSVSANDSEITDTDFSETFSGYSGGSLSIYTTVTGSVTLDGLNFEEIDGINQGGCVNIEAAENITVTNTVFKNCTLSSGAGGCAYLSAGDEFTANSTRFDNCSATLAGGAAILAANKLDISSSSFVRNDATQYGGAFIQSSASIINITSVTFSFNNATTLNYGGAFISSPANINVNNSYATENTASTGAAGLYTTSAQNISILNSYIINNTLQTGDGAGAKAVALGNVTIEGSEFTDNTLNTTGNGSGLYINANDIDIEKSLFSNNTGTTAVNGGGLHYHSILPISIKNSTFYGNQASLGGGLYADQTDSELLNNTLDSNSASSGGDLYNNNSVLTFKNNILTGSATGGSCFNNAGTITSQGHNIDQDGACAFGLGTDLNSDPLLATLSDNGGPTKTMSINSGSPALDSGDNSGCPTTDQRGLTRPFDGDQNGTTTCDRGAFESQDACPGDPLKDAPGICGCGVADSDANNNGVLDCLYTEEMLEYIRDVRDKLNDVKADGKLSDSGEEARLKALSKAKRAMLRYAKDNNSHLMLNNGGDPLTYVRRTAAKVQAFIDAFPSDFSGLKRSARKSLKRLLNLIC